LGFPLLAATGGKTAPLLFEHRATNRLRILVVDDDPLLLKSIRDILESDGHAVVTANHGQEAIDVFQNTVALGESFAAVITDLGMPYIDGRKVARAVKLASPSTPVILLTGWGQRLVADGEVPPHVDRVLNKPPKLRDLRTALAELTEVAAQTSIAG
jgi:CheY-like chemotaxis protein